MNISEMTNAQLNEHIAKAKGTIQYLYEVKGKVSKTNPTEMLDVHIDQSVINIPDYTHSWNQAGGLLEELPSDARARVVIVSPNEIKRATCEEWLKRSENHVGA